MTMPQPQPPQPPQLPAMPVPVLPYASPVLGGYAQGIWRDGGVLVMTRQSQLPHRCIKCNAPAEKRLRRTLYWHEPWLYVLILAGLLIYAIVALITRKSAVVEVPLCRMHAGRRIRAILFGWCGFLIGIGMFAVGIASLDAHDSPIGDYGELFLSLGILLGFGSAIAGILVARTVRPTRIDDHYVWLRGASQDYLADLPPVR